MIRHLESGPINEAFDDMEAVSQPEARMELVYPPASYRWTCATFAIFPWAFALVVILLTVQSMIVNGITVGGALAVMFVAGIGVFMGVFVMEDVWTQNRFSIEPHGIIAAIKFMLGKPSQLTWSWDKVRDLEIQSYASPKFSRKYQLILQLADGASHTLCVVNSADKALELKERIEEIRGTSSRTAFL
jgi:hypothetical protein